MSKPFYDETPEVAWCWASGLIEFGETPPANNPDGSGCIVIARGPKSALHTTISVVARHGKGSSAGKLLVPGVPEAVNLEEASEALAAWLKWCAKRNGKRSSRGVTFLEAVSA